MVSAEMEETDLPAAELAAAAAVIHGLCAKDDIEIPRWVLGKKEDRPMCLFAGTEKPENVPQLMVGSAAVCGGAAIAMMRFIDRITS